MTDSNLVARAVATMIAEHRPGRSGWKKEAELRLTAEVTTRLRQWREAERVAAFSPAFIARVEARTGAAFAAIPVVEREVILAGGSMGPIIAHDRETSTFVYWDGYPSHEDDDGNQYWRPEDARLVTL